MNTMLKVLCLVALFVTLFSFVPAVSADNNTGAPKTWWDKVWEFWCKHAPKADFSNINPDTKPVAGSKAYRAIVKWFLNL